MGGLHWNPLVASRHLDAQDAIYYNLTWPGRHLARRATRYAAIRQALKTAGVQVKDINVTLGGCAFGTRLSRSRSSRRGQEMRWLAALLGHGPQAFVVVDDDIDVTTDRGRVADRDPRPGRPRCHDREQRARKAARSEPPQGSVVVQPGTRLGSIHDSGGHPEGAL